MNKRELSSGGWWRWSQYQLRDGFIRSAENARLVRYDPWQRWRSSRPLARDGAAAAKAPYQELLEVLRSVRYVDEQANHDAPPAIVDFVAGPITSESERAILDWCGRYGLLGILMHRVSQVTLQPQGALQNQYTRTGFGWVDLRRDLRNPLTAFTKPQALVRALRGGSVAIESLATTWARFFPEVQPDARVVFQYPQPLTDGFWRMYAEPLADFLSGARALREALSTFGRPRRGRLGIIQAQLSGGLTQTLQPLIEPNGVVVSRRRGKPFISLVGGTLLASMALMMAEDLMIGRAIECPCGNIVVSTAYQARYCSKQCRWRYEQRKFRKNKKPIDQKDEAGINSSKKPIEKSITPDDDPGSRITASCSTDQKE